MHDDKLKSDVQRGQRASNIVNDELMTEATKHIDAEIYRMFLAVHPSDKDGLAFVRGMQYFHQKYQAFLKKAIEDGKMATLEIERRKKTLKERFLG